MMLFHSCNASCCTLFPMLYIVLSVLPQLCCHSSAAVAVIRIRIRISRVFLGVGLSQAGDVVVHREQIVTVIESNVINGTNSLNNAVFVN